VTRRADPEDQRYTRVDLTPRGEEVIHAIREIILEVEAEWEGKVGRTRFTQLKRLLAELAV